MEAIYQEDFLDLAPPEFASFEAVNAEFFDRTGLGSPGGASRVEELDEDHPLVAAWPTG